jgi:hypothetical protein
MTRAITLQDITICPVVEQQGPFFGIKSALPHLAY